MLTLLKKKKKKTTTQPTLCTPTTQTPLPTLLVLDKTSSGSYPSGDSFFLGF